ncbi:tRNA (N(6)-L-threonylcarbamoyladenosine(37)-C(2))-methylthiotransferase MtaB [bacterium]|nr:tRNA (N(6)-L-threonylcarbamoyladenosine(37)-C(2))-methylthiotransferase MtaB [bacterium]
MKKLKIAFKTLGCKANLYDTILIESNLDKFGYQKVEFDEIADIYIINTCSVTSSADSQSRQLIRKAKRNNPNGDVIVTGCYAQIAPDELADLIEVKKVFLNTQKNEIADYIFKNYIEYFKKNSFELSRNIDFLENQPQNKSEIDENISNNSMILNFDSRTRPFIKIQDGCKSFCSYCIIPYGRTIMKSMPSDEVIEQIETLVKNGYKEVVLTGIHLGYYGLDFSNGENLNTLLEKIEQNSTIKRVRISSIDPHEITAEFVNILKKSTKIQHHLHIALQYGDDQILKLMNRRDSVSDIIDKIEYLKSEIEDINFGFDVIIGFPSENETHFNNTIELIKKLKPGYLHVFPFSPRKKTEAYSFKNQTPNIIKKERARVMREVGKNLQKERMLLTLNSIQNVLFEEEIKSDNLTYIRGYSGGYLDVWVENSDNKIEKHSIHKVKVVKIEGDKFFGELI